MQSSKKRSSSFYKSMGLLVFLIVGLTFYSRLSKNGLPGGIANLVNSDFSNDLMKVTELDSSKKEFLKKDFSGFWENRTENPDASVQKWDHLELRDNGIIWQVINWFITFPSGDTASFYHIRHAYLNPYGIMADSSGYKCEVRVIRQAFVIGNDTCYGASQVDEMWRAKRIGNGFSLNDRVYKNYDAELETFFPDKMIDVVDKLLLTNCLSGADLKYYAKKEIESRLKGNAPVVFNAQVMKQWIEHYYQPLIIDEMLYSISGDITVPESLTVEFGITSDGNVVEPKLKSASVSVGRFERNAVLEIGSWIFPSNNQEKKSPRISHTFKINKY